MGVILKPNGELAIPSAVSFAVNFFSKQLASDISSSKVFEQASRISELRRSCGVEPSNKDTITIRRPRKFSVSNG